jgi:hypothetical protein
MCPSGQMAADYRTDTRADGHRQHQKDQQGLRAVVTRVPVPPRYAGKNHGDADQDAGGSGSEDIGSEYEDQNRDDEFAPGTPSRLLIAPTSKPAATDAGPRHAES